MIRPSKGSDQHHEAPFRSPENALSFAYNVEAQAVVKVSSYFRQMRGSTVRLGKRNKPLDPYDRHAQAALILAFLERTLPPVEKIVVQAYHTQPNEPWLEKRKLADMMLLVEMSMTLEGAPRMARRYVEDVGRGWVGYRRHHDDKWWERHLGCPHDTLRRWRSGRSDRGWLGFVTHLESRYKGAIALLTEPMYEAGLTRT